jgi:glycosyltransferase involved in cell wall biosynthesis
MSLIVRDEIELISANIEFHAAHGVDYFVVMDDGSTDGTWEQLQALQKTYEIDLIQRQAAGRRRILVSRIRLSEERMRRAT